MVDYPLFEPLVSPIGNFIPEQFRIVAIVGLSTFLIGNWIMIQQLFGPWVERKVMARMQGRRGPTYVGWRGLLQIPADLIKLLFKEDMRPTHADKFGFFISIAIISVTSIISFSPLPWATGFIGAEYGIGVLYVFAVFSLFPPAMFVAGWSGNSKYALIGGFRSAGQLIAYEIPMFVAGISIIFINSSFSLSIITENQAVWFPSWNLFNWYGLGAILGFIFFIAGLAESERVPFDIPEAEAELVMGPRTEFSGWRYALILMVEYIHLTVNSLLFIYLFFGGYDPLPFVAFEFEKFWLIQFIALTVKFYIFVYIAAWLRAALPRMRIDQLLTLGWKHMLPVTIIAFIGVIGSSSPDVLGLSPSFPSWTIGIATVIVIFIFLQINYRSSRKNLNLSRRQVSGESGAL